MELVERYVTRMAWDTLMEWWADYRDIYAYHKQVYGSVIWTDRQGAGQDALESMQAAAKDPTLHL
jgi:hypothetical protein